MAKIIDGKQIAFEYRAKLRKAVEDFVAEGNRRPQLTTVLVGTDPASSTYIARKMEAAKDVGIDSLTKHLSSDIKEKDLLDIIENLNNDSSVDAILVQLPVPDHIDERKICNAVSYQKDVDGFNERNVGRMCLDMKCIIPCTPLGVVQLLKYEDIETFGKNVVVIGRSKNVGMPIAMLLHTDGRHELSGMDSTVTICHRHTPPEDLKRNCLQADIIISATGLPHLIKEDMVKPGACIIDVGITRVMNPETGKNKLVGDVDFEAVKRIAGHITPVPGGVGPMTVAMLMQNTLFIAKNLRDQQNEHN